MNFRIYLILFLLFNFLIPTRQQAQARECDTLYSYPNITIPSEEGSMVSAVINFPANNTINDINFYVGISTFADLPGELIIRVSTPWGKEITLHNHNKKRQFPCWIDSQAEADGPGSLDEFVGHNARGPWVMYVIRYNGYYPFIWDSWAIEVDGEPLVGIKGERRPLVTGLDANYPNPFNSATVIHFTVAKSEEVSFAIYDILGGLVRNFEPVVYKQGHHQLKWNGANAADEPVSSGMYFLKMAVGKTEDRHVFTRKLTLLR